MIPSALKPLFIRSGFAEACPIMAHVTCLQQQRNFDYLDAIRHPGAQTLAAEKNETDISPRNMVRGRRAVSLAGRRSPPRSFGAHSAGTQPRVTVSPKS